ncbi:MAG TPA: DUF3443 domain-containing protein [Candidatus Sulfotelmatobacter sp.]|nr:DUF3443 domain-containing protein [Candidatus Sulfotelmatobacter sp.]
MRSLAFPALLAAGVIGIACGGGSSHQNNAITPPGSSANVQAIVVNSGPAGNYANGVFTSVTVCVPSSSTCQTINGVLVDTGSFGLRLLSSAGGGALTMSLPQQNGSNGNPVGECAEFVSGFTWGPVVTADVQIAGEKASAVPVQVIDPSFSSVPQSCKSSGVPEQDTLQQLGANGILGVGPFLQDCGGACTQSGSANPGIYFECASGSCQVAQEALAQQVSNPVGGFATDNNGVIVELPSSLGAAASLSGSLVFGIGTESNNGMGSVTVFPINANGDFTTSYSGQSYPGFIDSGSNALFFLNTAQTSLPSCTNDDSFYCPSSTANLSARDSSGSASATVQFSVANANSLFGNSADFVFGTLAGPNPGTFDWGLPFFFGRNVFTAIESHSTPAGQGPFWAF